MLTLTTLALSTAFAVAVPPKPTDAIASWPPDAVPADLKPALAAADQAMGKLQAGVLKELNAALAKGGPEEALGVCGEAAGRITEAAAKESGIAVGRTSHRVRNPKNAPPDWARAVVEAAAGKKAKDEKGIVLDLGDKIAVLRPIQVMPMCMACHGDPGTFSPKVRAGLAERYPKDQATGFAVGDLRGFRWAEAPKNAVPKGATGERPASQPAGR